MSTALSTLSSSASRFTSSSPLSSGFFFSFSREEALEEEDGKKMPKIG